MGMMTIDEAIEQLQDAKDGYKEYLTDEALDLAIKALEQEPTTKNCESCKYYGSHHEVCNYCYKSSLWTEQEPTTKNDLGVDLISRSDVNRLICEYRDDATETGNERDLERAYGANAVGELISELPSVTPQEPMTGHWIGHREHCENLGVMPSGLGAYEWCSNCDCGIDVREWHRNHYNYCPNCGAKMVEPQESEKINMTNIEEYKPKFIKEFDQFYVWICEKFRNCHNENDKEYLFSILEYLKQTKEGKELTASYYEHRLIKSFHPCGSKICHTGGPCIDCPQSIGQHIF